MDFSFKEYKHCYNNPPMGSFALDGRNIKWDSCREQFAARFNENMSVKGFFFCHSTKRETDIASFVHKFENVVFENYTNKIDYSTFSKTSNKNVLWVELSSFWLVCPIRKSLLTMLFRTSMNYFLKKDNFDESLFGEFKENVYLRETKTAVLRFMFGFTMFVGKIPIQTNASVEKFGWYESFKATNNLYVCEVLRFPKGESELKIGVKSLWT